MRILLTGATGFVGSHVARRLLADGFDVVALRRQHSTMARLGGRAEGITWRDAEATPAAALFGDPRRPIDAVVHVATAYARVGSDPYDVFRSNVAFPLELLNNAVLAGVGLFVNTDTFFNVPGSSHEYLPAYTLSKRHFQEWGERLAGTGRLRFVNLRLFHVVGPSDSADKFVPSLVGRCLEGATVPMTSGLQRRDFVSVDDVAEAYRVILREESAACLTGYRHCDVGTGESTSVRAFAEMVNRLCGGRAVLSFGALPDRPGEIWDSKADPGPLLATGWRPAQPIERAIEAVRDEIARVVQAKDRC